jgi:hypothetical protein
MKQFYLITIALLFATLWSLSWGESGAKANYRITKAVFPPALLQKSIAYSVLPPPTYTAYYCPGTTTIGCKIGTADICPSIINCAPTAPPFRNYICVASPNPGCGEIGAGSACATKVGCSPSSPQDPPTTTAIPCNFGSIPFGCFNITGGPSCGTLVNCQIPPP